MDYKTDGRWLGVLTVHGVRLAKCLEDVGIYVYHQVVIGGHLFVAHVLLLLRPPGEVIAYYRKDQVDNPLARELVEFLGVGQVACNIGVVGSLREDIPDCAAFILRNVKVLDGVRLYVLLLSADDVCTEVDR